MIESLCVHRKDAQCEVTDNTMEEEEQRQDVITGNTLLDAQRWTIRERWTRKHNESLGKQYEMATEGPHNKDEVKTGKLAVG